MKKTIVKEDYIKFIYKVLERKEKVTVSIIANEFEISYSSVSNMLKKLKELGWINYEPYKSIYLTRKGEKISSKIVSKHRLTEMFLVDVMGFKPTEVHQIAEEIEHINNPAFFNRMRKLIQNPIKDPHGSEIPKCDY